MYKPSFELPHTMDGQMEKTFPEIINFVENNYRTINDKASRAIAGLSMGGFHTLHISRYYRNTFGYMGLFSPAINPRNEGEGDVYENIDATLKNQINDGVNLYWIGIGKTDFLYNEVAEYRQKLDQLGMRYTYFESEGGHTWNNWRTYLTQFTQLLFQ